MQPAPGSHIIIIILFYCTTVQFQWPTNIFIILILILNFQFGGKPQGVLNSFFYWQQVFKCYTLQVWEDCWCILHPQMCVICNCGHLLIIVKLLLLFIIIYCKPSCSETLKTPDHKLLTCKWTQGRTSLWNMKCILMKSQPLRFDNPFHFK